ncbi:alpha/beta hydrolase [Streptomyces syringium]|uniref:alpha/beta hydrolase n=1 Tax=Streptomyces syringium TaxID=76729 RepID=UPI0034463D02
MPLSNRTHRKALLLTLATTAVAATLATPVQASPASRPTAPALTWKPCESPAGATECATLSVPMDYRDPGGRRVDLAVSRLRGADSPARRGTLLVIPGGPGGSGVARLATKGTELRKQTGGAYDIVSFDPRGVGGSTPADCGVSDDDRELTHLRPWPGPDGDITANVARARRVAAACEANGGAMVRNISTANEVRDIESLRRALGEEKLSAWATSYGTYVGAVYAQKYPHRTDRWVLDSNGDPDPKRVARGWSANMSVGAEDRFPDFAAWAADPARDRAHRLAERPEDVRPMFLELAAQLDATPRKFADPAHFPLTGNRLRQALQQTLYSKNAFDPLAELILAARDTTGPLTVRDVLPGGPLSQRETAVMVGTLCNDVGWPHDIPSYARAVTADRARHPLTAGMPVGVMPCAFWKTTPTDKPVRLTPHGPSNILMIQNLRDPATPHHGARKMREALGDRARLVTVDSGGHGAYLANGNTCGDRTVTDFLTTGRRPAGDVVCPKE